MTSPFFISDVRPSSSSSRIMSMADRQNQLMQQRRQIIRQQSQNLSRGVGRSQEIDVNNFGGGNSFANTAADRIVLPSRLPCTSTAIHLDAHEKKSKNDDDGLKSSESCDDESHDGNKENEAARPRPLKREDNQKKISRESDGSPHQESQLSSAIVKKNESSNEYQSKPKEIANVSTTYASVGGSDKGYQRYLEAYHNPPKSIAGKKPSVQVQAAAGDLTGSRKLCSTSSSRPISRTRRRSQESSLSSTSDTISTTQKQTTQSTPPSIEIETAEKEISRENDNSLEREQNSAVSDSSSQSIPSFQQPSPQLSSFITTANLDDPIIMRSIILKQCPKGPLIQCCIRRNKGTNTILKGLALPEYRCYLKGNSNSRTETFLMTSKKRGANKTSNYLISMGRNDHDKDSSNILGKLRGNFHDTEYILYDNGKNPEDCNQEKGQQADARARVELGAITYSPSTSASGSKGPRAISVCINKVDKDGNSTKTWQPFSKRDECMLDCLKKMDKGEPCTNDQHVTHLHSKSPAWDKKLQRFFLNFSGRVTMASVKNFQLVLDDNDEKSDDVCLQFGRTGKDEFILDVGWPLSLFQGFALALSSFDSKVGTD